MKYSSIVVLSAVLVSCATPESRTNKSDLNPNGTIEVLEEEIADYDPQTGIGCSVTPDNISEKIHVLCRSRRSAEKAWDAVTAKSKILCVSQKWKMLFERPPSLPKEGKVYRAQMDILCLS